MCVCIIEHNENKMTPKDLDKLISKYNEGKCTPEEIEFIESWYSSLGISQLEGKEVAFDVAAVEDRILE